MARKPADAICMMCGEAPCECNRKTLAPKRARVFKSTENIELPEVIPFVAPASIDETFTQAVRLLADEGMLASSELERYKMILDNRPASVRDRAAAWRQRRGTDGKASEAG
jgi:hypothetical protein